MPPLTELDANARACTAKAKPRKRKGIKDSRQSKESLPTPKRRRDEIQSIEPEPTAVPPRKKKTKTVPGVPDEYDVDEIVLDGEAEEAVPIYDTCDDLRLKIRKHLALSGMTQAAFLRQLSKCFPQPKKLQSRQLKLFLDLTGSVRGCESAIYYGAYVYFEKLRIKNEEGKSVKRQIVEEEWEDEGAVYVDEYGHNFTGPE